MNINDLIQEFKLDLEISNYSTQTIRVYINSLNVFAKYMTDVLSITEVEDIKALHLKAYQKFNKERGLKTKSLNSHISALRKFFDYLIEEEIITKNPALSIKLQRAKDIKAIEVFTKEEIKLLTTYKREKNVKSNRFLEVRDNLIINFLLETGCRCDELINLRVGDINDGYIYFKITRNNKARVVPFSLKLKKLMLKYDRERLKRYPNDTEYYFCSKTGHKLCNPNVSRVVKSACDRYKISSDKAFPHNFRHTFAVNMLRNSNDIYLVSKLLGHQSISITEIYMRGMKDDDIVSMTKGLTVLDNI
jgi:integrase/recombinase XerD